MYEYSWSVKVFERFRAQHVLACREVNRLYQINVHAVLKAIMAGSSRWRGYKSLVKHVENTISLYWKAYHSEQTSLRIYPTFDKYLRENLNRRSFPAALDLVDTEIQQELF